MTAVPRHRQTPVSIRSDKAAALLARLTRRGRSQAEVIEDALEKAAKEARPLELEEKIARIDAIVRPLHGIPGMSFKELDDELWDEDGLPR
ncbi:MAG: type II toxin-antitoxin system VapB family antitoxin [Novosphingobium sp.]|nr:type II toxin-antitoxin system VapB family antitoxin [Novosphingobium sp.]